MEEPGSLFSTKFISNIFISLKHRRCLIIVIRCNSKKKDPRRGSIKGA